MLNKTSRKTQNTTLKKNERINKHKEIGLLFTNKAVTVTGAIITLKLAYTDTIDESPTQCKIFISIPKKKIKKAVDRNKIKRQIREIYRNNKILFPVQTETILLVGFIYNAVKVYDFNTIKKEIISLCNEYYRDED